MALCANCGFDNPEGMRFCGQCGSRLSAAQEPLGVMMGPDLAERFRRAGLEASGQRRNVTILFVDITGYTLLSGQLDSEDLYGLIQQTLRALAQAVYKFEGVVDKFTGDGLMALFGAPVAHENNAELAVRSALEMQAEMARLNEAARRFGQELRVHIGLHAGPVVVGSVGSDAMMNYTAIGDTVNLARRLEESASPGTILVSEAVYQQTRALFEFEPTPPLALKGFAQPVRAHVVLRPKARPGLVRGLEGLTAPMVGRDAEFIRLKKAASALLTQPQGQFVLITGEGGIGKSRLTRELKELLQNSPVRVVEGQSLTYRRTVSYWTFVDALRNYLGVAQDTPEAQVRERLSQSIHDALGLAAGATLPYLEYLLSLTPSLPGSAEWLRYMEAGQLRQQIFLAVRDWLVAEARRRPVLLILEDLHWADDASLDLLRFLVDTVLHVPLLICAVSRPVTEGALMEVVNRAKKMLGERLVELPLQNLSLDQSERLLFQLLPLAEFPERWLEPILQRAAGIPYYLEEILRMLIDDGAIQWAEGRWQLAPQADLQAWSVPETLQGLILARFDRLEPGQRRVLQVASVIGREFSLALLAGVLPDLAPALLQQFLAELAEREFIVPQADSAEIAYAFKHVLVSDAIYSTMLRRTQSELHGQIGAAMETLYADQLEKQVELLARHYAFSPRRERALHYLIWAGQKAARAYLTEQARQHYEQALALLPETEHTPEQALQVQMGLGDVLLFAGEYAVAREHFRAALAAQPHRAPERSDLQRKIGLTFLKQSEYEQALAAFAEAQSILERADQASPAEQARILSDIGWTYFERGDVEEAQRRLSAGLALVEDASAYDVISSLYNRLGAVAYRRGDWAQAASYVSKSISIREAIGDRVGLATSFSNLGLLNMALGEFDQALHNLTRGLELKSHLGDLEGRVIVQNNLGNLRIYRGELEAAAEVLEEALKTARQLGLSYLAGQVQRTIGEMHVAARRWSEACAALDEALRLLTEIGARDQLVDVYRVLGEAWLGAGHVDVAREYATRALRATSGTRLMGPTEERGFLLWLLGAIDVRRRDWSSAETHLKESQAIFRSLGNRMGEGRALYQLGLLAQEQGEEANAHAYWLAAADLFRAIGAKLETASAQAALTQLSDQIRSD